MNIAKIIDVSRIGKLLAYESDIEQSEIINAMGSELQIVCRNDFDMQLCGISDKLDKNGRKFILQLAEFIKLRENNEVK